MSDHSYRLKLQTRGWKGVRWTRDTPAPEPELRTDEEGFVVLSTTCVVRALFVSILSQRDAINVV